MELGDEPFGQEAFVLEEYLFVVELGKIVPGWDQFHQRVEEKWSGDVVMAHCYIVLFLEL